MTDTHLITGAHAITIIVLLCVALFLLLWILTVLSRISRQLAQSSAKPVRTATAASGSPPANDPTPNSDFDRFIAEDPARLQLTKKEQAAAYRTWRKKQGLTWNT